jgi:hypothetical protein
MVAVRMFACEAQVLAELALEKAERFVLLELWLRRQLQSQPTESRFGSIWPELSLRMLQAYSRGERKLARVK